MSSYQLDESFYDTFSTLSINPKDMSNSDINHQQSIPVMCKEPVISMIPDSPIIYKKILSTEIVDELITCYYNAPRQYQNHGSYIYDFVEIGIPDEIRMIITNLFSNYVLIQHVAHKGRIHHVTCGGIAEHRDVNYYNNELQLYSKYTLIIYLTDVYEGGQTEIRRQKFSLPIDDLNKEKFERHHLTPSKGYGVLFPSELIHCAQPSYGDKYMLILRIW